MHQANRSSSAKEAVHLRDGGLEKAQTKYQKGQASGKESASEANMTMCIF